MKNKNSQKWNDEEIELLSIFLGLGYTHAEIANELDRTTASISGKIQREKLQSINNKRKTTSSYKLELPDHIEVLEKYINNSTKILHKCSIGHIWKVKPTSILQGHGCPFCNEIEKSKTHTDYLIEVPKDIEVLGTYINAITKIEHKHVCGYKWYTKPTTILQGSGCPSCAKGGFKEREPGITYLIYFPDLLIYKFGVTNNFKKRRKDFGSSCEVIMLREFNIGKEALILEKEWGKNLKKYLKNTQKLKSGNTETFYYE